MAEPKNKEKLDILIIADIFNQKFNPWLGQTPLGLLNIASVTLLDMTLEWVSHIDANVHIILPNIEEEVKERIKLKWLPYINVEVLVVKGCFSFGDVMRVVDRLQLFTKNEFILIENVPTFCSSHLTQNFEAFKALRKDRTVNGKKMLGKDNLMTIVCTHSKSVQALLVLEKSTNRLLIHHPDENVTLTKNQFQIGCVVHTDLKQAGIYFCAPEIITKFTDNSDVQTFNEQIGNITAQDETICEYIHVDIVPDDIFVETANDIDSLYECLFSFLHHNFYPCTFDSLRPDITNWKNSCTLQCLENNVYLPRNLEPPPGTDNTVFGGSFNTQGGSTISGCFFGPGVEIGANANLSEVICGRNVKIGHDVKIRRAIIDDNAKIEDHAVIEECILLSSNEKIPLEQFTSSKSTVRDSNQFQTPASDTLSDPNAGGLRAFDEEIHEYIRDTLAEDDWNDEQCLKDLIREINRSRFNYNIPMDDVARHVFVEFMKQPRFGPTLDDMKKVTEGWRYFWTSYYKQRECKIQILHALEEHVTTDSEWVKYAPNYVLFLFNDIEVLTDEMIIDWYNSLDATHVFKNNSFDQLIQWLQEDDDESSGED